MDKVVIIKTGETLLSLASQRGDFEDWILAGMGLDKEKATIIDVCNGSPLPTYDGISGIVITGSHALVTEHKDWSERTAEWLPGVVERKIPLLGICYGHQLLAYAMGGNVEANPNGLEFGTIDVKLHSAAKKDLLFYDLPDSIRVNVAHYQSVLRLPPNSRLLASSEMDQHQAFVVGDCAWGIQFHPEFDAKTTIEYINNFKQLLREGGTNPDYLITNCSDTPDSVKLLKRFVQIVKNPRPENESSRSVSPDATG